MSPTRKKCPFCETALTRPFSPIPSNKTTCRQCGGFEIADNLSARIDQLRIRLRQKIGFWIREQVELGEQPRITENVIELLGKRPEKTVLERAERLLRYGIAEQKDLGGSFSVSEPRVIAITHSRSSSEFAALLGFLSKQGWLSGSYSGASVTISPEGFIHAGETKPIESVNGFIAMWFDKSMNVVRQEGLEPAIRAAGYSPVIADGIDHINKIDDEIISEIRKARFLVADFTGHRGGVYFEAGFAMGLGLPVFWTCRRDEIPNLHFDIRQYNCIDWIDAADLETRLRRRIEAVIGAGPVNPGPGN